jgi:ribosomal protein S18 acetylase RimI-like enzyme
LSRHDSRGLTPEFLRGDGVRGGMSRLRLVSPDHPAAAPLLAGLRREYHDLYGPEAADLDRYSPLEFLPPAGAFVILEDGGATAAGGALRRLGPGVGEIKRMWTAPAHRGRGHARRVLLALEEAATRRGYYTLRLETGDQMTAAIALYRSAGYEPITGYGPWGADPRALSFEKRLDMRDHLAPDELDRGEILVRKMLEHHAFHARLREVA